jgi:DNA polymerase III delta prime subunit
MKYNAMFTAALIAVTMLTACASQASSGDMASFKKELAAANAATDKAASVGGEWRDIRWKKSSFVKVDGKKMSILAAAEAYAKMGDFDKADKLVKTAMFQAKMGYQQAMEQKHAKPMY